MRAPRLVALLLLTLAVSPAASGSLGLGVSVYEVEVVVMAGGSETFPVVRVYNTGNETLHLNVTALVNCTLLSLQVPGGVTLEPGENRLIEVTASAAADLEPGIYPMEVGVVPVTPSGGGSPVAPSHTVTGTVEVVPAVLEPRPRFPWSAVLGFVGAVSVMTAWRLVWRRGPSLEDEEGGGCEG